MGRKPTDVVPLFQPKKCVRWDDEDRISELPDDILIGILCCLPLKEAALTSAVSSRWRNLWKYAPRLNFDAYSVIYKISMMCELEKKLECCHVEGHKYVEWVNQVVQSHKAPALKEFRVSFYLDQLMAKTITKWLEFAFSRQVERLELESLNHGIICYRKYVFPDEQLLRQNKCIGGGTLKALSLKGVDVTGESVEFFLLNCPSLEHLVIHGSCKLINLEVCGPSLLLKYLEIVLCTRVRSIKVSAPNLSSLTIPLLGDNGPVLLESVPSLVQLNVCCMNHWSSPNDIIPVFSSCFSQLEVLTLTSVHDLNCFSEVLNILEFPQLKRIEIEFSSACYQSHPLHGLTSFIKASPYLQEFVLKSLWFRGILTTNQEEGGARYFFHQHLKVFKFLGYYGTPSDLEFVRFISVSCVVLEKIVIDPYDQYPSYYPLLWPPIRTRHQEQIARIHTNQLLEAKVVPHHIQLFII